MELTSPLPRTHATTASMAAVAAVLFCLVLRWTIDGLPNAAFIPGELWLATGMASFALVFAVFQREVGPIGYCAAFYFLFSYMLPGIIHMGEGVFPFFNPGYSSDTISTASWLVVLFIACFGLAYWRGVSWPVAQHPVHAVHGPQASWVMAESPGRFLAVSIAFALLALLLGSMVGWQDMLKPRGEVMQADNLSPGMLILQATGRALSFVGLIVWIGYVRAQGATLMRLLVVLPLLAGFFIMNYPLAVPRFNLAAYAIATLFVLVPASPLSKGLATAVLGVALVTVFPMLNQISRGSGELSIGFDSWVEYLSYHGDFDGLQSTLTAVEWVANDGYRLGRQLLSAALFFLPREMWSDKSIGTGGEAATYFGFPFINLSTPLPAELFVDFGIPGLMLTSTLAGYLLGVFDRARPTEPFSTTALLGRLPAAILAGYMFIIMRGSLVGVLGPPVIATLVAIATLRLLSPRPGTRP